MGEDALVKALQDAERLALEENNYLGVNLDDERLLDEYDTALDHTASAEIADRARQNRLILSQKTDFRKMILKEDHASRPIWVCPNGHIYLEAQNKLAQIATDFLVAISEPESRPEMIHHYKLTPYSLYAAVSVNVDTDTILTTLDKLSKVYIPEQVIQFISRCTESHGKAKLVLKRNRLYIESLYPEVLKELLKIKAIREAQDTSLDAKLKAFNEKLSQEEEIYRPDDVPQQFIENKVEQEDRAALATDFDAIDQMLEERVKNVDEIDDEVEDLMEDDNDAKKKQQQVDKKRAFTGNKSGNAVRSRKLDTVVSFEIRPEYIEQVKESAMKFDYPLMEEYDFRNDQRNPDLPINLRATTKVRSYQEKSLAKMFGNNRGRSGIIVLPCGAGKTLTGITAACTIKKSCIIFCINNVGVEQWIRSVKMFTNLKDEYIRRFTSDAKDDLHPSGATLLVTTYTMMSYSKTRAADGERVMEQVRNTEWGLIVMDEVHVVPAKMFRMALRHVKSHCKLGLTATLVREDNLIDDLNFLIGPKLYEANWQALTEQGYLAKVLCAEVWCPMTAEFFEEYLTTTDAKRKQLLYVMNPNKFSICKMLMEYHEKKKDKVLIFSDNIPAIKRYSKYLRKHNMYGTTKHEEREAVLRRFRGGKGVSPEEEINVLVISQVGDVGIDLPQANVIIQISSHFGSRRQEAQRLGRILRPKSGESFNVGYNAFFYSLISMDTSEMYFSNKRQKYLVDQGYSFKVIRNIKEIAKEVGVDYQELTLEAQRKIQQDLNAENVTGLISQPRKQKREPGDPAERGGAKPKVAAKNSWLKKAIKISKR